ncbi:hypothetical protein fh0823_12790 [Francisella halioticida]|uniref:STAS domain-containing protein n=1 Tax=Francisella halioticida TaxID=549298 RepID=A0ABM6M084_9GAMM|nr:STAS domain-containing protein [Francisella halioticida]ASG68301.1 hypothetical protein CDV26_07785 [Francisella halioticida]BCD91140.1 hypothetical protein fh0823_12790 [Francisella halioticida]
MEITYSSNEKEQTYILTGRLDQSSYSIFENFNKNNYIQNLNVYLNLENLEYISSIGLRAFILLAKKVLSNNHKIYAKVASGSMPEKILKLSGFDKLIPLI